MQESRLIALRPTILDTTEKTFQSEKNSFAKLKDGLLNDTNYLNKFVAVVGGKIVDSDNDDGVLAQRVYRKFGYISLFIGKIEHGEETLDVPSPELV